MKKTTKALLISSVIILSVILGLLILKPGNICSGVVCKTQCDGEAQLVGACNIITGSCDYKQNTDVCNAGCTINTPITAEEQYKNIYNKSITILNFENNTMINSTLYRDISRLGMNTAILEGARIVNNSVYCEQKLGCDVRIRPFNMPTNTKITFAGNFLVTDNSQGGSFFSDASQSNGSGYGDGFVWIGFNPGNRNVFFNYADGMPYGGRVQWNNAFDIDRWTHIAVISDITTQTATLYKNGISLGTLRTNNIKPFATNTKSFYIGDYYTNYRFNYTGYIDDVTIFNDSLTMQQIKNLAYTKIVNSTSFICKGD